MWLSVQCVATMVRWYSRGEIRLGTGAMVVREKTKVLRNSDDSVDGMGNLPYFVRRKAAMDVASCTVYCYCDAVA